jgi:hypothetical protein
LMMMSRRRAAARPSSLTAAPDHQAPLGLGTGQERRRDDRTAQQIRRD